MNITLWIVQIVLAVLYLPAGLMKVVGQAPKLEQTMPGVSLRLIRGVGLVEALAGLGLVLPAVGRSWMAVAGWGGAVLAAEAVAFVVYHARRKKRVPAVATVVLGLLATFVVWGRLG